MDNPFKKLPPAGPPSGDTPVIGGDGNDATEEAGNLCPVVGTMPVFMPPKSRLATGAPPEVQHVLAPCIEGRCAWWDADAKLCSQVVAARAQMTAAMVLSEIRAPLLAIGKMFGK
jgi:hypothetical protein